MTSRALARVQNERAGPHGSPGDATHRPETREAALLAMRKSYYPGLAGADLTPPFSWR